MFDEILETFCILSVLNRSILLELVKHIVYSLLYQRNDGSKFLAFFLLMSLEQLKMRFCRIFLLLFPDEA